MTIQPIYPINKQKLFQPSSKAYFILNSLYQSYKKKNEFKLLKQKIHKIKISSIDQEQEQQQQQQQQQRKQSHQYQQLSNNNNAIDHTHTNTTYHPNARVKASIIFSTYQQDLTGKQICKFIQIQQYLRAQIKQQLLEQILKSIQNQRNIKEIMKCYQKMFTTKYLKQNKSLKQLVQQKMIKKVLSLNFQQTNNHQSNSQSHHHLLNNTNTNINNNNTNNHTNTNKNNTHTNHNNTHNNNNNINTNTNNNNTYFSQISQYILGFPQINQNIIYFIGLLFDKISTKLQDFDLLYSIMKNNLSFKLDNLQQAIENKYFKKQLEALIKINNKDNLDVIKTLLKVYIKARDRLINNNMKTNQNFQNKYVNILKIAQTQAKYKFMKITSSSHNNINKNQIITQQMQSQLQPSPQQPQYQQQFNQKTLYILKFILQVIKSGCNLWSQIQQYSKTSKCPKAKQYLFQQINRYLQKSFSDEKKFKNIIIPNIKILLKSTSITEKSQIYKIWFKQLIKQCNHKYNQYKSIKQFIVRFLINLDNFSQYSSVILSMNLLYEDVLFSILAYQQKDKAFAFYKQILQNQSYSKLFIQFLIILKDKSPVKLKDFLIQFDQLHKGQLFMCGRYLLVQFIKTTQNYNSHSTTFVTYPCAHHQKPSQ